MNATTSKINEHTRNCYKMTQVCRTCLEEIGDTNFLSLSDACNRVKDELVACIPELDLDLVPHAAVCVYCANALHAAYDFKQKCLQTEETIRSHMQDKVLLDLEQIKKETECDDKFAVVHGPGIGMEVIYIRDDDAADEPESELIISDTIAPTVVNPKVEPVNLFLNMNHSLSSQMLGSFLCPKPQTKSSLSGVGVAQSIKKKKNTKQEPKAFYNGRDSIIKKRSFDCARCSFSTTRAFFLKQHMQTHDNLTDQATKPNGAKLLKCDHCDFTTSSKITLKIHTQTHTIKKFSCPNCDFQTKYRVGLYNHMKNHNNVNLKDAKLPVKKQNLKCSKCDYKASNLVAFKKHVCSNPKKDIFKIKLSTKFDIPKTSESFKCTWCNYVFPTKTRLSTHELIHTGEKPFKCKKCNYKANQQGHIDRHMKFHLGTRRWKCSKCSYSANNQRYLQLHMEVHNN